MKKLYIFDFDDTLFDTYGFYADVLVRLNLLHGLDVAAFESGASKYETKKLGKYDFYGHLRQHLEVSRKELRAQLIGQLPRKSYLFPDAVTTLARLTESAEIVILTVGMPMWQRTKFDHAPEIKGIKRKIIQQSKGVYLNKIISEKMTDELPTKLKFNQYQKIILVDDSIGNFTGLSDKIGFQLIRIRREGAKHSYSETPAGIREIASLDEI